VLPVAETLLSGQSEQKPGPKAVLYWLILHGEHMPLLSSVYPALQEHAPWDATDSSLHSQAVSVVLPAVETVLSGQSEQLPGPKPALYWFTLHCEHAVPFSPVYPALHKQAVLAMLPAGEKEFEGQPEQMAGPNTTLY